MRGEGPEENHIATRVIGAAIEVHRLVGPGLLESTYQQCLAHELSARAIPFEREVRIGIAYKGLQVSGAYRAYFIVAGRVVLELKVVDEIEDVHKAQLLTYLRWTGCKLGLLLNFGAPVMKRGIVRVAHRL